MLMETSEHSDFKLSYRKRGDMLFFQVSGDIDSQAVRIAYRQEIVAITRKLGIRKLLVVDRKKHQPATQVELAELARRQWEEVTRPEQLRKLIQMGRERLAGK